MNQQNMEKSSGQGGASQACDVPVIVVGGGPVGVTIANLLGVYGVGTLLIERSREVLDYPRAVGLDDEALRTFQAAGLAEAMLKDMIQNVPMRMYTAKRQCVAEILPATREFGWFRRNLFSQPLGERTLRKGLERFDHVRLELGTELIAVNQDAEGVTATVRQGDGAERRLRAQYLIAADGGRSTVREQLLKLPFTGKTHPRKWVVIECDDDPLDAPYTALHCDPGRPYVCLRLPYGLRRWEFMLFPGEDDAQILEPAQVRRLLQRHVESPDRLHIIRARVYTHNSRVAETFVDGRICLAGDAAHITPPWIGQGLNAGLRDAGNVAWKVAGIVNGTLRPEALRSYHSERHAHAAAMIDLADTFGALLSITNRPLAKLRDWFFLALRWAPGLRDYVLQMKFKPMPRYRDGVLITADDPTRDQAVGRLFIQPLVEMVGGAQVRLDDALGPGYALLSWRCNAMAGLSPEVREGLARMRCRQLIAVRSRSGAHEAAFPDVGGDVLRIEDAENALHFWFEKVRADWVLIRTDRYVAAAGTRADADALLGRFIEAFVPSPTHATTASGVRATGVPSDSKPSSGVIALSGPRAS